MLKRIISALIVAIIFIPLFIIGGMLLNVGFYIVALLGLREFMKAKQSVKKFPDFIRLISYIMITFLYFSSTTNLETAFYIDYKVISGIFLTILLPVVLYHDEKLYDSMDAMYLLGGIFFIGYSMSLFYIFRSFGLNIILFLFLITVITDSYAYFIGKLIGKNKLLEVISPNKTWEGTIGGSLVGTFVCTVYYYNVIGTTVPLLVLILIILFMTLIGQFGDLFFSAMKRMYKIKDFSNIMPGHGGVLDRLDSILFVMLVFTFFFEVI